MKNVAFNQRSELRFLSGDKIKIVKPVQTY